MSNGIISGNIKAMGVADLTFDPSAAGTQTIGELTATLAGAKVGDFVVISKPSETAGLGLGSARVSAADTVAIQFVNPTAAAIDADSETYKVLWFRPEAGSLKPSEG